LIWIISIRSSLPDLITNLPGLKNSVNFTQYAGYLEVDSISGRKLFYWFVESQSNPSTDPVVLWLNGGPGCSSLIGFLSENGPFRPSNDGNEIFVDPYSWNRIANMLYLEAPAGVGFSYSNNPNDYNTDDKKTAEDNYSALQIWFKRFPAFIKAKFYISGESYGGHYVPMLANQILEGNKNSKNLKINLQGIMVGNGLTDNKIDLNSFMPVYAYHNLIPMTLYQKILQICKGNYIEPSDSCQALLNKAYENLDHLDPYDIYAPVCPNSGNSYNPIKFEHPLLKYKKMIPFDPCIDLHLTEYLNREDVRKAIHVDDACGTWFECSNVLNYNFSMSDAPSMIPYYEKFFKQSNYKILIYSGDVDSILPTIGSQEWIDVLNRTIVKPWRPWLVNQQVGGFVQQYDKLTLLTIHGAGHMVPYFKPANAYDFFKKYILDQPY
jgi:serine carboxypeptidase-like clade 2